MVETQSDAERSKAVVRYLDSHLSTSDRLALIDWAQQLLSIRNRQEAPRRKARQALLVTLRREVILAMLSSTAGSLKGLPWSDLSWSARLGLGAAAVTGAVASGKGAGIAALGGAVGVPLWIVLGAGGSFAGMLIDELSRAIPRQDLPVEGEDLELPRFPCPKSSRRSSSSVEVTRSSCGAKGIGSISVESPGGEH